jgi:hypothetical protein
MCFTVLTPPSKISVPGAPGVISYILSNVDMLATLSIFPPAAVPGGWPSLRMVESILEKP